jgi:hypothetical protein
MSRPRPVTGGSSSSSCGTSAAATRPR